MRTHAHGRSQTRDEGTETHAREVFQDPQEAVHDHPKSGIRNSEGPESRTAPKDAEPSGGRSEEASEVFYPVYELENGRCRARAAAVQQHAR